MNPSIGYSQATDIRESSDGNFLLILSDSMNGVIGAGMGGLAAAGALADFFDQVVVLERDTLPSEPAHRAGTPQARHVHALLLSG